jgi:membrane protease YdiL (CAAX protease family)
LNFIAQRKEAINVGFLQSGLFAQGEAGEPGMKDVAALLVGAAIVSALAWAFWHYLGDDAFTVISTTVIIVLFADNARLRNRIRASEDADQAG